MTGKWITDTTPVLAYQWDVKPEPADVRDALDRDAALDIAVNEWLPAYEGIAGNGDEGAFEAYMNAEEKLAAALRPLAARRASEGIEDDPDRLP